MIQKLYDKHNDPDVLQHIVDILNDGGIIIYPTDTMYAMGCHALKERPIEKICRLRTGRTTLEAQCSNTHREQATGMES